MKNEETIFEDEKTQLDVAQNAVSNGEERNADKGKEGSVNKKTSIFRSVGTGLGMGILLGSTTSFIASDAIAAENEGSGDEESSNGHSAWADGEVDIASGISDDMTFSEAFSSARAEIGPGGAFEWHGNVYSTYTAEEWGSMSPEEQGDYYDHFAWSGNAEAGSQQQNENSEVVPVDENGNEIANGDGGIATGQEEETVEVNVVDNQEVEVLGVIHDDETGANIGGIIVDNQEAVLIDVDGSDDTFEYMAADLNGDGQIAENEVADISDQRISVSQMESNSIGDSVLYASNDGTTDYINETPEDYDMA